MNNKNIITEIILALLLIGLVFVFIDPFSQYMDKMTKDGGGMFTPSFILLLIYTLFIAYIWKEKPRDEREGYHAIISSRFAYTIGVGVAVIGIITQSINHTVDQWLIAVVVSMVLAKLIGRIYNELKH